MKARSVILLLCLACILVVGAAFLKIQHVPYAEYALSFAMLFQLGVLGYIVFKSMSGKPRKNQ